MNNHHEFHESVKMFIYNVEYFRFVGEKIINLPPNRKLDNNNNLAC